MHSALTISIGHLLMQDAAAGCHPLHITGYHLAFVAQAISVFDRACEHVSDRLDAAMRMPRESREVVLGIVVTEIIEQKERIELLGFAKAKGSLKLYARAFGFGKTKDRKSTRLNSSHV